MCMHYLVKLNHSSSRHLIYFLRFTPRTVPRTVPILFSAAAALMYTFGSLNRTTTSPTSAMARGRGSTLSASRSPLGSGQGSFRGGKRRFFGLSEAAEEEAGGRGSDGAVKQAEAQLCGRDEFDSLTKNGAGGGGVAEDREVMNAHRMIVSLRSDPMRAMLQSGEISLAFVPPFRGTTLIFLAVGSKPCMFWAWSSFWEGKEEMTICITTNSCLESPRMFQEHCSSTLKFSYGLSVLHFCIERAAVLSIHKSNLARFVHFIQGCLHPRAMSLQGGEGANHS